MKPASYQRLLVGDSGKEARRFSEGLQKVKRRPVAAHLVGRVVRGVVVGLVDSRLLVLESVQDALRLGIPKA